MCTRFPDIRVQLRPLEKFGYQLVFVVRTFFSTHTMKIRKDPMLAGQMDLMNWLKGHSVFS